MHGQTLAPNAVFTCFGSILEAVGRGDRATDRRHHQAFQAALDRGDLDILTTPAQVLTDTTTGLNRMLKLTNGSLSTVDVSWHGSSTLDVGGQQPSDITAPV